jgi:hypothetical protein
MLAGAAFLVMLIVWQTQRQDIAPSNDVARSNDRVLVDRRSPDARLSAFIVKREADALSSDVIRIFVSARGAAWHEGKMLMLGRRFSRLDQLVWLSPNRLCLLASANGVEEQVNRAWIEQTDLRFQVHPDAASCERGSWS